MPRVSEEVTPEQRRKIRRVFEEMLELFEDPHKWTRGRMRRNKEWGPAYCLIGGLLLKTGYDAQFPSQDVYQDPVYMNAFRELTDACGGDPMTFNDRSTSVTSVRRVLRTAIDRVTAKMAAETP